MGQKIVKWQNFKLLSECTTVSHSLDQGASFMGLPQLILYAIKLSCAGVSIFFFFFFSESSVGGLNLGDSKWSGG